MPQKNMSSFVSSSALVSGLLNLTSQQLVEQSFDGRTVVSKTERKDCSEQEEYRIAFEVLRRTAMMIPVSNRVRLMIRGGQWGPKWTSSTALSTTVLFRLIGRMCLQ